MRKPVYADFVEVRVFIEGVLFPYAKSISVSSTRSSVSCSIEVPPSIKLRPEEWAGATCHIFYANKRVYDKFGPSSPNSISDWPILFQGELVGSSHQNTVSSENVVLEFTGHSKHFDQTLLFYYSPDRENPLNVINQAMFLGNTQIDLDFSGVISRTSTILATLQNRLDKIDSIDTNRNIAFTSIILDILRQARDRHITFKIFDDKLKLTSRFASYVDPDIKNMITLEILRNIIDQKFQALDSNTSLMRIMEIATNYLKYDWVHIPQPHLRKRAYELVETQPDAQTSRLPSTVDAAVSKLVSNFKQGLRSIDIEGGIVSIPPNVTRTHNLLSKEEFTRWVYMVIDSGGVSDDGAVSDAVQKVIDSGMFVSIHQARGKQDSAPKKPNEIDSVIQDINSGDPGDDNPINVIDLLKKDQDELTTRDELNEFVVVPNMQFSQPPRCNVIMPYNLTSYGMVRSHTTEPTRLYGRFHFSPDKGEDLVEWYLAPSSQCFYYTDDDNISKFSAAYQDYVDNIGPVGLSEGDY